MAPDLLDMKDCEIYFGEQGKGKGKTLLTKLCTLEDIELENDSSYSDIDILSLPSKTSFSFKFNKKSWYRVQKALGLIKPIYKKKQKGKRYVWYEII